MSGLRVVVDDLELDAEWTDDSPETRAAIEDALPLSGDASRWGDELYFSTPVNVPEENGREEVPVGAMAYWPRGTALCLFWGPTPASASAPPRAASAVNLVAMLQDPGALDAVEGGARVRVEKDGE